MVRWPLPALVLVALAVTVTLAPEPVVLGALRLAAYATIVAGASLLVARVGAADLALAAAVALGAYAGGVGSALAELPVVLGLPLGATAGAVVGGLSGCVHGRLGRTLGALASLAVGVGVVATVSAWSPGGGVAGFHAVALPTPFGVRADLVAVAGLLAGALALAAVAGRSRSAALAAMAVRAPQVVLGLGYRPAFATGRVGAVAGALCGLGGVSLATVTGSVMPGAFGLELSAALVLASLVGGIAPWGPLAGTALVWGPSTLWPLVPLVGTAPPLLVAGPLGLVVLALRRGRPLVTGPHPPAPDLDTEQATRRPHLATGGGAPEPRRTLELEVRDLALLDDRVSLTVGPGDVVALTGPNGSGKSTLLAMVGGQLDDDGRVSFGSAPAPRGFRARGEAGLARSWQHAPDLRAVDVLAVAGQGEASVPAAWARDVLGGDLSDPGVLQLILLASRRPGLVLLDEPTGLDPAALAAFVGGLSAAGAGVLVVDHRPEVLSLADRVVRLEVHG